MENTLFPFLFILKVKLLTIYNTYLKFFNFSLTQPKIMVDNKVITIHEQWHSILGEKLPLIDPYHYVKLSEILSPPKLSDCEKRGSVAYALHYIRQKVKMWGADVLRAENIKNLIEEEEDDDNTDEEFFDLEENPDFDLYKKNKLARFDCIASLLASAECTVAQDIIRTMSQFPIALPLT